MNNKDDFKKTLIKEDFNKIYGQAWVKKQVKSALLTGRHLIIVGNPGIGKTTLAKSISKMLPEIEVNNCTYNCSHDKPVCPQCKSSSANKEKIKTKKVTGKERFIRVQGSPDLTAEDLLGDIDPIKALKFGPLSVEAFTPGKIFKANNGVLFFDELNRCPEKLQNALLQVLSEKKATIGSYDIEFPADFIFIATMNPEDSSTEPLSDVLLDRFDVVYMKYPETKEIEERIVETYGQKIAQVPKEILSMMAWFVRDLRNNKNLEKHPSVRATIGLYERAQANAILAGRNKVNGNDVNEAVESVIAHRIKLKPSVKLLKSESQFTKEQFEDALKKYDVNLDTPEDSFDRGDSG